MSLSWRLKWVHSELPPNSSCWCSQQTFVKDQDQGNSKRVKPHVISSLTVLLVAARGVCVHVEVSNQHSSILPAPRRICLRPFLFVCWLFCWFLRKITNKLLDRLPQEFGGRMGNHFGSDPDEGADPGIFFITFFCVWSFSLIPQRNVSSLIDFQGTVGPWWRSVLYLPTPVSHVKGVSHRNNRSFYIYIEMRGIPKAKDADDDEMKHDITSVPLIPLFSAFGVQSFINALSPSPFSSSVQFSTKTQPWKSALLRRGCQH